jgi:hypothetical protein
LSAVPVSFTSGIVHIEPGTVSIDTISYLDRAGVPLITETNQTNTGNDTSVGGFINWNYVATPTVLRETTATGGKLNFYVVQPLGLPLVREYWI